MDSVSEISDLVQLILNYSSSNEYISLFYVSKGWRLSITQCLIKYNDKDTLTNLIVKSGCVRMVEIINKLGWKLGQDLGYIAAEMGDINMLSYLHEIYIPFSRRTWAVAVKNGHLNIIQWLHSLQYAPGLYNISCICDFAVHYQQRDILVWIKNNHKLERINEGHYIMEDIGSVVGIDNLPIIRRLGIIEYGIYYPYSHLFYDKDQSPIISGFDYLQSYDVYAIHTLGNNSCIDFRPEIKKCKNFDYLQSYDAYVRHTLGNNSCIDSRPEIKKSKNFNIQEAIIDGNYHNVITAYMMSTVNGVRILSNEDYILAQASNNDNIIAWSNAVMKHQTN